MMSWGGTFMVTVWRFTFTIRSMNGMMRNSPGPLAPANTRPSRKITPRSYSWTIRIALNSRIRARNTMAPITMSPSIYSSFVSSAWTISSRPSIRRTRTRVPLGMGPFSARARHRAPFTQA